MRSTHSSFLTSSSKHGPSSSTGNNTRPMTPKTKLTNALLFKLRHTRPSSHTTTTHLTITGESQPSSCTIEMTFTTQKNSSWDTLPENTRSPMQLESRLTTAGGSKSGGRNQEQYTTALGTAYLSLMHALHAFLYEASLWDPTDKDATLTSLTHKLHARYNEDITTRPNQSSMVPQHNPN